MFRKMRKMLPGRLGRRAPFVPVVRLSGTIGLSTPLKPGLTLANVAQALEKAYSDPEASAVAIIVNSPGGSPVQSHLIFKRIRAHAEETGLKTIAFVEDVAASGGYMLAAAGDEIVVDESSIVGSIGVISASFGFDRLIEKIGIDRRVYTSGERKMALDPFQPEQTGDVRRLKALQRDVHDAFIDLVRARRGDLLRGEEKSLFSGEFWSGRKAIELGLADRVGDLRSVLRERYGDKVRPRLVSIERSPWRWRGGGVAISGPIGAGLAEEAIAALEERAMRARYGL
ncbi:MAG TPA: S49 family peptidase [Kaistiaceae bacterium]|nr:S49 family peptidase [Kaistiaceae bacterium]